MRNEPILIYGFTGFLDSGKTTFIKDTLEDPDFSADGLSTLILMIEEGEEELSASFLEEHDAAMEVFNSVTELTNEKIQELVDYYNPGQIIIEFNGMEPITELVTRPDLPECVAFAQILTTIDATTFGLYVANMRSLVYEQCRFSDLVVFNRCDETSRKSFLRGNVKAINTQAQIVYEDIYGNVNQLMEDDLPFDFDAEVIEIKDEDYGLWYMDCAENPAKYDEKKICLKGMYCEEIPHLEQTIILGRQAMVCCEDDTSMISLTVTGIRKSEVKIGEWLSVEGTLRYLQDGDQETVVLYASGLWRAEEPKDPYVSFS